MKILCTWINKEKQQPIDQDMKGSRSDEVSIECAFKRNMFSLMLSTHSNYSGIL